MLLVVSTLFSLDFPSSPADGDEFIRGASVFRYKASESSWYLAPPISIKKTITQTAHGFVVGDVVRISGANTFTKAQANTEANSQVVGIVESINGANEFTYVSSGRVVLSGLTAASIYYLSAGTSGAATTTKPSTDGQFVVNIYTALNTTTGWVNIGQPTVIGLGTITNISASGTVSATTMTATTLTATTINGTNIVASGKLQLPRVTTAARIALCSGSGDRGVNVYDTDLNSLFYYNGSVWVEQ
jgi:hypothetical protein